MFSIILVTWKNQAQAQELIDSIVKFSYYKTHEIIVFCNELDPSIDLLPYTTSRVVTCGQLWDLENIGLSKATNKAAKYAKKEYIVIIDDDMTVTKDWDYTLLNGLKMYGQIWAASTVIEYPAPHYNLTPMDIANGRAKSQPMYHNISNCPILMQRKWWEKIGGYDEDFPTVGAELGLAMRAYNAGERIFLQVNDSFVHHKQSQSMNRLKDIRGWRKHRDKIFVEKYKMTRTQFTDMIQKGVVYDPVVYG